VFFRGSWNSVRHRKMQDVDAMLENVMKVGGRVTPPLTSLSLREF
jgi:hypothetical protein